MPTLTMPSTPSFKSSRFGLSSNTRVLTSPFTRSVQTLELTGARWFATYTLPSLTRAQAGAWQAFLLQLRGQSGRFFGFDPDARSPLGTGLGTPLVNGASQTGATLLVDGWPELSTGLLLPGDYFTVNGELKMVSAQVDSDSSGEALISFEPPLRTSPPNDAALTLINPTCTMMLTGDEHAWDASNVPLYGFTFSGVEAFT